MIQRTLNLYKLRQKYTRNEWRRKTTLETSEDVKLHSKRVEKMHKYTRNEFKKKLETSEDVKLHSKRVETEGYTRNEWRRKATLETSWEDA